MSMSTKRSYIRSLVTAVAATGVALIALAAPASAAPTSGPQGHLVGAGYVWQNNSQNYWQTSPNGRNTVKLVQEDPSTVSLVVDHDKSSVFSWQTNYSFGDQYASWQTDGNLVVYNSNRVATWSSGTNGVCGGSCTLWVQDDGNVVIYKGNSAVWATNTHL